MDCKEEQDDELEALKAIYTDEEFKELSSSPWSFEVTVTSEMDGQTVCCVINFTLPEKYPEVVPAAVFVSHSSLSDNQLKILQDLVHEQADDNIGMPMIYTLTSEVQYKLQEFLESMKEEEIKRIKDEEERILRAEEAKYKGTTVTKESFFIWKEQFTKEMNKDMTKVKESTQKGLTGKQMFERDASLILSDTRFLLEMEESENDDKGDIEIDESLFQDLGDLGDEVT